MCVLIVCTTGTPTKELLLNAARENSDGAGYAYVKGSQVHYSRGVGRKAVQEVLRFAERPTYPCLLHFRLATIGEGTIRLAHPFPVPLTRAAKGRAPVVIAQNGHNGRWAEWMLQFVVSSRRIPPRGEWSDTRALAWLLQESDPAQWKTWLEKVANSWGKIALADGTGIQTFGKPWLEGPGYVSSVPLVRPVLLPTTTTIGKASAIPTRIDEDFPRRYLSRSCDVCNSFNSEVQSVEGLWLCLHCSSILQNHTTQEERGIIQ